MKVSKVLEAKKEKTDDQSGPVRMRAKCSVGVKKNLSERAGYVLEVS